MDGLGTATAPVFDGLIQNALGTWSPSDKVKPLLVSMQETWPPIKNKFICEVAATIYSGNECPAGQESTRAQQAIKRAEVLYNMLNQKGYMK